MDQNMDDCETNINHKPGPSFLVQMETVKKDKITFVLTNLVCSSPGAASAC